MPWLTSWKSCTPFRHIQLWLLESQTGIKCQNLNFVAQSVVWLKSKNSETWTRKIYFEKTGSILALTCAVPQKSIWPSCVLIFLFVNFFQVIDLNSDTPSFPSIRAIFAWVCELRVWVNFQRIYSVHRMKLYYHPNTFVIFGNFNLYSIQNRFSWSTIIDDGKKGRKS